MTERFGHQTIVNRDLMDSKIEGKAQSPAQVSTQSSTQSQARPQEETAKCRQIIDGARAVFLAQGFDAASMGEIARRAGVSKGTLYVYFDSKEELFAVIAHEQCHVQAEQVFSLDHGDHDVEGVLTRLGTNFVKFLCRPE